MQESGFSLSFRMLDKNSTENQVTFRGETANDWGAVLTQRAAFCEKAAAAGWQPISLRQAPTAPQAQQNAPAASRPANNAPQNGNGAHTFHATKLSIQFSPQGKKLGKLHGGSFQKYGVTVWPEVAEQFGFDLDTMNPGEYQCDLHVAYVVNDQDKPQKVTGLVGPPQQAKATAAGHGFSVEKGSGRVVSPPLPDDDAGIPF